jgi:hypothetical protein
MVLAAVSIGRRSPMCGATTGRRQWIFANAGFYRVTPSPPARHNRDLGVMDSAALHPKG